MAGSPETLPRQSLVYLARALRRPRKGPHCREPNRLVLQRGRLLQQSGLGWIPPVALDPVRDSLYQSLSRPFRPRTQARDVCQCRADMRDNRIGTQNGFEPWDFSPSDYGSKDVGRILATRPAVTAWRRQESLSGMTSVIAPPS